jgi:Helix-turn-helix.
MSATSTIKEILEKKGITQVELSRLLGTTRQNISNKMNRDSFNSIELTEVADVLNLKLAFIDEENNKTIHIIDYPESEKHQPKRKESLKTE